MDLDVTYRTVASNGAELDLVDLRRALGALTQAEAAQLVAVRPNTWARWERGELQLHPARTHQVRRLQQLAKQYGDAWPKPLVAPFGVAGALLGVQDNAVAP